MALKNNITSPKGDFQNTSCRLLGHAEKNTSWDFSTHKMRFLLLLLPPLLSSSPLLSSPSPLADSPPYSSQHTLVILLSGGQALRTTLHTWPRGASLSSKRTAVILLARRGPEPAHHHPHLP